METTNIHLSYGTAITQPNTQLTKINIHQLINIIQNDNTLKNKTQQLRSLHSTDPKTYNIEKKQLPYIVGGIFSPPIRKLDNFGYIRYFILDIDHLSNINKSPEELKQTLKNDNRIILMFTSPSANGLKIIMLLQEKCSNHHLFSSFYKNFATQFSKQYQLYQVIDPRTSDATRACFLCHDPQPFINLHNIQTINFNDYISSNTPDILNTTTHTPSQQTTNNPDIPSPFLTPPNEKPELDDTILQNIKQILSEKQTKNIPQNQTKAYITQKLAELKPLIPPYLQQFNISHFNIREISYALQISCYIGNHLAEINLFHGKKGFNIVRSTKSGTNPEATETLYNIIQNLLIEQQIN